MSTPTEDRLRAALHARADQVQSADLRLLEVPAERRGARRGLALGLVAAAAAAAVVAVLLGIETGSPDRTPPPPAGSPSPSPSQGEGVSIDVDGDGGPDRVHLDFDKATGQFTVRVDLYAGESLEANGVSAVPPELLTGFDLDGDTAQEVAVFAGVDPGELPYVFTYKPDEGLVPIAFPNASDGGAWRPGEKDASWATRNGHLYSWAAAPGAAPDGTVDFWQWRAEGASAVPVGPTRRCLGEGVDFPVPCSSLGSVDVGPRGDLPALFPAVGKTYKVGETWTRGAESVELVGRTGEYVEKGDVELVVHVDGIVARADVPAGGPPELLGGRVRTRGDAPVFVVRQEGGDSMTTTVFTFWNGELIALPQPTDAPFGDGFREVDGSTAYHRTWLSEEGVLYTSEGGVDDGTDRSRTHLWRWSDDFGKRLAAEDLGVACIDFSTVPPAFGRCP